MWCATRGPRVRAWRSRSRRGGCGPWWKTTASASTRPDRPTAISACKAWRNGPNWSGGQSASCRRPVRGRPWSWRCLLAEVGLVRVALCDDHAIVRSGLRRILDAEHDLEVVGEAGSVREAVVLARAERPDVFVMDLGLPDGSGITGTAEVRKASPATRVLVLTVHDDVAYLRRAFEAGAAGWSGGQAVRAGGRGATPDRLGVDQRGDRRAALPVGPHGRDPQGSHR